MRENKGFTLIELLAVIVILAIIALIATPVILGIIEDSRKSANERSAEMIKAGVQNAYTSYLMAHNGEKPAAVTDFLVTPYFTVDSATASADSIITNDVSCTVAANSTSGKIVITCTGTFAEPAATSEDMPDAGTRIYSFTGDLKVSSSD